MTESYDEDSEGISEAAVTLGVCEAAARGYGGAQRGPVASELASLYGHVMDMHDDVRVLGKDAYVLNKPIAMGLLSNVRDALQHTQRAVQDLQDALGISLH